MESSYSCRIARRSDAAALQAIERAAATRFVSFGMPEVSASAALDLALIEMFLTRGIIFLMSHEEQPVALVAACMLDGCGHVAELDVVPEHAGRRLGSQLIDRVAGWAKQRGASLLTLMTYAHVPWNAPYYARLGFREASLAQLGRAHQKVWEEHRSMGLDMRQRVVMARALQPTLASRRER